MDEKDTKVEVAEIAEGAIEATTEIIEDHATEEEEVIETV